MRTSTFLVSLPILIVTVGFGPAVASAQPSEGADDAAVDSLLLRAKTFIDDGSDRGSVDSLRQAYSLAKRATEVSAREGLAHYYAALANYRIANQLPEDAEDRREPVVEEAIRHLKQATDAAPEMADAWILLSGCYGQMMGMNPLQGMSLGPKSNEAMEKAKELAPDNPRLWIVGGTSDFYTPSMFGGDKERALKKFKKAARLAEQESIENPLMPSWGHAEAYAWIGIAQMDAERHEKAREAFEKALSINPDYGWVRYALLPKLKKQAE